MFLSSSPPPAPPRAEGFHLKVARAQAFRLQSTLYRFPKDKAEKLISITNVERLHFSAPERSVNPGGPWAGDEEPATSRHVMPAHSHVWYRHSHVQHPTHTCLTYEEAEVPASARPLSGLCDAPHGPLVVCRALLSPLSCLRRFWRWWPHSS